ncbi:MAG: plasmid pRiA4b family protein [Bacteroidota bacterium]|jgi:hypothetical protein|nr:plasmid pRiA4b family protein [Bacteroidota bacterium]
MVYRFKITFEDNEDVYREIEIKSTQTFEDFHNAIVQSISFDNMHDASFFISDDYYRKGEEIRLKPAEGLRQMKKCKMALLIDDPHQKFVYVYDPKTQWTFMVELLKIVPDDVKASYPKVAKSVGEAPKQHKASTIVAPVDEEDFDDHEPHSDDEAYTLAHSEDETALLEGEEGEEEVSEEADEEAHDDEEGSDDFAGSADHEGDEF